MKTRSPLALVDELGRIAGRAEPPPIADGEARWIVERALDGDSPAPRRRPAFALAFAFAGAIAAVIFLLVPRVSQAPRDADVLHLTLPTGDRLTGVAGARFDVERLAATDRRLRLHGGLVLFEVAHVARGQHFTVATPQLVATAKGTIFSVETDATSSRVRVYEGVVEVEQGGETHLLAAGGLWDSATHTTAIALARPAAIAPSIDTAIRERKELATLDPNLLAPAPIAAAPAVLPPTAPAIVAEPPARPAPAEPVVVHATPAELEHLLGVAQTQLADGKLADALATVKLAESRGELGAPWWLVAGDASRGLGHADDAAEAFDRAARDLTGAERAEAGYSAAYIRFHDLDEPVIALTSLIVSRADEQGSPLEERALGLHAEILKTLGRKIEAHDVAVHYLERFPKSDLGVYMQALVKAGE
jgi:hypothetical protein